MEVDLLDADQHGYAARARQHRHMRIWASLSEGHTTAVPRNLQESRRRQIGGNHDGAWSNRRRRFPSKLTQHAIAHVAQIRSTGTEIQILRFVISAYLRLH